MHNLSIYGKHMHKQMGCEMIFYSRFYMRYAISQWATAFCFLSIGNHGNEEPLKRGAMRFGTCHFSLNGSQLIACGLLK